MKRFMLFDKNENSSISKASIITVTTLLVGGMVAGTNGSTSALTYQSTINPSFTINPTITVSLSSTDLVINNLSPSTASDSNIINITTQSNNSTGYVLTTTVGNNTSYNTTDLIYNNTNNPGTPITDTFTSLATTDNISGLNNITNGKWGYSFSSDSGTTWSNYSGLPLYTTTTPKELVATTGPSTSTVKFKIAASAKDSQMAGEYNNVINFIATTNPVPGDNIGPVSTRPKCISYNPTVVGVTDTMDDDCNSGPSGSGYDNNATANLWASNFQRPGYGFVGWSDKYDWKLNQNDENGNGTGPNQGYHIYGPNYTITTPNDMTTNGLSLYAVWVPSAGDLQSWTGCSVMTTGQVTALTDSRDQQTYAVARLADGNCWMIENLRLDNQYTTSAADIAKAQGYNSSFIGLANPENTLNWTNSTTANSLYSTDGSTSAPAITGYDQAYRFPRYDNQNTASPATNMTAWNNNSNTYSVGNYYTWAAAIADTSYYTSGTHNTTSICPAGWHIPSGGSASAEYGALDVAMGGTGATQTTTEASMRWRRYPQNFVYSGYFYSGSPIVRGSSGYYWSSTVSSSITSYSLLLGSSLVTPGTNGNYKYYGGSVRCLAGMP